MAALVTVVAATGDASATPGEPVAALKESRERVALCVVVGCGQPETAALAADLAQTGRALVHGLALDEESAGRARRAIRARDVAAWATVERLPAGPLPHLRNLADLVVVEPARGLTERGIGPDEALRITVPGGVVFTRKGTAWECVVKPGAPEFDVWTHIGHGPGDNRVSQDREVVFPGALRWQDGIPFNLDTWAGCRAMVISERHVFTVSSAELENGDQKGNGRSQIEGGKPRATQNLAARGSCLQGYLPANGMYCSAQNKCGCTPSQLPGMFAFGPSETEPDDAAFSSPRVVERGPAFGAVPPSAPEDAEWTQFLHDAARPKLDPAPDAGPDVGLALDEKPEPKRGLAPILALKPGRGGLCDAMWRRSGFQRARSGCHAVVSAPFRMECEVAAWNDVWCAVFNGKTLALSGVRTEDIGNAGNAARPAWTVASLAENAVSRVSAMALCRDALVVCAAHTFLPVSKPEMPADGSPAPPWLQKRARAPVTSASPASPYELLVLDADTGAVRARHALPANPALGGIAVAGGMVVVCCEDGAVLGFGAAN